MQKGFQGRAPLAFMTEVHTAHSTATKALTTITRDVQQNGQAVRSRVQNSAGNARAGAASMATAQARCVDMEHLEGDADSIAEYESRQSQLIVNGVFNPGMAMGMPSSGARPSSATPPSATPPSTTASSFARATPTASGTARPVEHVTIPDRQVANRKLPFDINATTPSLVGVTTGIRSARNIVADSEEYNRIAQRMNQLDDRMAQCAYRAALRAESMLETIYIMPQTNPEILRVTGQIKAMLNEYQAVSEALMTRTRNYADDIVNVE